MVVEQASPASDDLAAAVWELHKEAGDLRRVVEHHTIALKVRTVVMAALLAVLAVAGAGVAWELHQQVDTARQSAASAKQAAAAAKQAAADRRSLCPLVEAVLIPRPGDAPPVSRRGIEMTKAARDYATAIHC